MRNRASIATCALGLLCTFVAAPVMAGVSSHPFSPTLYWFCQSSTNEPAYGSPVVVTVASGKTNESIVSEIALTRKDIEKSFADFLAKKYRYTGLSSCLSNESQYWMESYRNNRLEALRIHKQPIVETGWTYAGAASAPAAPAPVTSTQAQAHNGATGAAATPVKYWVVCWVRGMDSNADRFKQPVYISGAVPVPLASSSDYRDVATAFAAYVAKTKPLPPGMTAGADCVQGRSAAGVMQAIKQAGTTPPPGQGFLVDCDRGDCIMTDWNNLPASPTTAATPPPPAAKPCGEFGWKDPKKNCTNDATPAPAKQPVAAAPVAPSQVAATRPANPVPAKAPVPRTLYAACWGKLAGPTRVAYFGRPFETPLRDIKSWTAAYKEFLHDNYQFAGVVTCGTQNSAAAMQKLEDGMRVNWKIIDTGWKYP